MLRSHVIFSAAHERLIRSYPLRRLSCMRQRTAPLRPHPRPARRSWGPVSLMRAEAASENLGGLTMLNALSTALFAIALRLASEVTAPPDGLLAFAANPRLIPALTALFSKPARAWLFPSLLSAATCRGPHSFATLKSASAVRPATCSLRFA